MPFLKYLCCQLSTFNIEATWNMLSGETSQRTAQQTRSTSRYIYIQYINSSVNNNNDSANSTVVSVGGCAFASCLEMCTVQSDTELSHSPTTQRYKQVGSLAGFCHKFPDNAERTEVSLIGLHSLNKGFSSSLYIKTFIIFHFIFSII